MSGTDTRVGVAFATLLGALASSTAFGAGGPLGIDHRLAYDNSGIWKRGNQTALEGLMIGAEVAGALWEGGESRLGKTYWQSIDATLIGAGAAQGLKRSFTRERPITTSDPDQFFKGNGHYSFPSGEVTNAAAIVTPFILEYRNDNPAVWALAALPAYDGIARMKVQAHWQTDVLAGAALGAATGYYTHQRETPLLLSVMPHGVMVGLHTRW